MAGAAFRTCCMASIPRFDDLAKLTTLLQHGGRHQGQQLLHAAKLAEALYQTDARGLPTGWENRFGEGRYHRSFWSMPYRTATGCHFQIPFMSGVGGNIVVLLPNGITAFRVADGGHHDLDAMVRAGEAVRPFPCAAGSAEAPPAPPAAQRERPASPVSRPHALRPGRAPLSVLRPRSRSPLSGGRRRAVWDVARRRRRRHVAHHPRRPAVPHVARMGWRSGTLLRRVPGGH